VHRVFSHTQALCPVCGTKVPARIVEREQKVFLDKFCAVHGHSSALISSDSAWYRDSMRYVKPKQMPLQINKREYRGCPESCGSCPEHQQHSCLPVIEITSTCNLSCPICLKRFQKNFELDIPAFTGILDTLLRYEGRLDVINLSGGEPTLHPRLGDFLRLANDKGVMQTTVSTNGLLFLTRPDLRELFRTTGTIAALQFDGFRPSTTERLRGRNLTQEKQEIIRIFEQEGIRYSLVATVARGINDDEIPVIADAFFPSNAVSLMLQPAALTGAAGSFGAENKLTIPDVVHVLENSRYIRNGDFNPLPCSHYSCFALSYYFILEDDRFLSLKEFLGTEGYLDAIANKTLPGLDSRGFDLIRNRLYDVWSLADAGSLGESALRRVRQVLHDASRKDFTPKQAFTAGVGSMKAIFIHDLMDRYTFDFGRLIKCCNPYPQPDGRLIPMCSQNVFFQENGHA
jgi:uncharacterized radical SAM superfamily Fe-S cluster-containing enzyme